MFRVYLLIFFSFFFLTFFCFSENNSDSIGTSTAKKNTTTTNNNTIELLEKENLENELKRNEAERERNFMIVASLFLLIIGGVFYNRYYLKKIGNTALTVQNDTIEKQKKIVEEQKRLLENSTEKIVDSITYAQKIQQSLLPDINFIKQYLPQTGVFYQPKDLVSGDFYWYYHENNISYISVADCTGHGVPGALLNMLGNSLLNKIIMENKITEPELILSSLNKNLYTQLQQDKGTQQSQDGMDIALCCYNHLTRELKFSGARSNAFLVNKQGLTVLKSTSNAVGGLSLRGLPEPNRVYEKRSITITEPTLLFILTDGYVDQIGGVEKRKLGIAKFKDNITGTIFLPVEKIIDQLSFSFNSWKSNNSQIDDVLVFCTRLS